MRKINKGDTVLVIAGKDKGKIGEVIQVLPNLNKVMIAGVGVVKKATKPNPSKNEVGGLVDKNMPIDISNVVIYNNSTKSRDTVIFVLDEHGKKKRFFKSNNEAID